MWSFFLIFMPKTMVGLKSSVAGNVAQIRVYCMLIDGLLGVNSNITNVTH